MGRKMLDYPLGFINCIFAFVLEWNSIDFWFIFFFFNIIQSLLFVCRTWNSKEKYRVTNYGERRWWKSYYVGIKNRWCGENPLGGWKMLSAEGRGKSNWYGVGTWKAKFGQEILNLCVWGLSLCLPWRWGKKGGKIQKKPEKGRKTSVNGITPKA